MQYLPAGPGRCSGLWRPGLGLVLTLRLPASLLASVCARPPEATLIVTVSLHRALHRDTTPSYYDVMSHQWNIVIL